MSTAVSIITPIAAAVLAFVGAVLGQWWSRRSAQELDHWRRREETMRMLRWGVELAADSHSTRAEAGLRALTGLTESELLQAEDQRLVDGIATMFLEVPLGGYTDVEAPISIVEGDPDDDG